MAHRSVDHFDRSPERRVYIQIRGIEQVCVFRFSQRGRGPADVPFIPAPDIGQDVSLGNQRPIGPELQEAPSGPDFGGSGDK